MTRPESGGRVAGQHLQQRGLAVAVAPDDADRVAVVDAQADRVEQRAGAVADGRAFDIDQVRHQPPMIGGLGVPNAQARPAVLCHDGRRWQRKRGVGRGGPFGNNQASGAAGGHRAERAGSAALRRPGDRRGAVAVPDRRRAFRCTGCGATSRPTPGRGPSRPGPPVLMVHPMMMSADMWDVTRDDGAVGILHKAGVDPWVIDFGSPDKVEGGMDRNLADHVVALSEAIDTVKEVTGRDVHLAGYSQGGMFAYQTAAYRRSKDLASIIAFGSPVDTLAGLPMNLPASLAPAAADFMADHVFSRIDIPGWLARTGFQMLDPIKTAQSRLDFLRQLHDREALLPREQQRRFLASEGWIAWSGPAIAELLKQFIAHNRMMSGGFSIRGDLVTLSDIDCPVLAVIGEVDDIGQPASVRGIKRAAPRADVYEYLIRAGHFGLVVGSKAASQTWPTVRAVGQLDRRERANCPTASTPMALQPAEHSESGVSFSLAGRSRRRRGHRDDRSAWRGRRPTRCVAANKSARTLAVETSRTLPRLARLGQINDHTRISLGRIMSEQARDLPDGECLLFDGRVHTYEAVDRRINNVVRGLIEVGVRQGAHVGVLMETRPSALVAIAALSRLGRRCGPDAARRRPGRRGAARRGVGDHRRPEPIWRRPAGSTRGCWYSAAANRASCTCPTTPASSTWRRSTPTSSTCPAGTGPTRAGPRPRFRRVQLHRGRPRRPPDHQLPLGAVGVRHRVGRQPRPRRHRLLPHPAASPVRAAGEPRRRGRRRIAHRAVAGAAAGPVPAGDPPIRRDGGVVHLGDAARGHRRPGVLADRQPPRAAVHRIRHADRPVEARHRGVRARPCGGVLRHHRRAGGAGQRLRRQDRQQGQAAARRRRGRTGRLRPRGRPDPRGRPRIRPARPTPTRSACCWPTRTGRWTRRRRSNAACSPRPTPGCRPNTCSAATRTATIGWSTTVAR